MGMFDKITCEMELPNYGKIPIEKQDFQTKSMECTLNEFVISEDGRLLDRWDDQIIYTGEIFFKGFINNQIPGTAFIALFAKGKCLYIEETDQW